MVDAELGFLVSFAATLALMVIALIDVFSDFWGNRDTGGFFHIFGGFFYFLN